MIYDFNLENGSPAHETNPSGTWIDYKMGALILENEYIRLKSMSSQFHYTTSNDELVYVFECSSASPKTVDLKKRKK